jgi:poly [ADP-ribose] polymerase
MDKANKHSTKCHGSKAPPESSYVKLDDVIVPAGKAVPTKSGSGMGHNEYIVYNVNQAKIRYVIRMKMK